MSGMRQKIQYSLALEPAHQGETPVGGCQGTEPVVAKPAPQSPALAPLHVGVPAQPRRTAGYVTRMPGGVGGAAPRGAPLSRSSALRRHPAASQNGTLHIFWRSHPLRRIVAGRGRSAHAQLQSGKIVARSAAHRVYSQPPSPELAFTPIRPEP
jgi:hypothetical protein